MTYLFGAAQCHRGHCRHESKRYHKAGHQRICNGQSQINEQLPRNALGKNNRRINADSSKCRCNDCTRYLFGTFHSRLFDRIALSSETVDILDDNDGVIHQHTDTKHQTGHGNNI